MSYALTEEQLQVRDLVRRVARERVAARAAAIDASGDYPQDMFDLLRELGLFTLPFPAEYGGSESTLAGCLAVEELGRVCYNTGYLLVVQWVPLGAILAGGTPEQKARLLPGLASGALRGAFSLTEPQSGSDVAGIRTRAREDGDGFVLNGGKIWCTNAAVADFVLLGARLERGGGGEVNFFIVERDRPGFRIGCKEEKMGARGVPSSALFLDDVRLPRENLLGDGAGGFRSVMEALNKSRPIVAARAVGLAQGAMDHAIAFARDRRAFGQSVVNYQGIRWMIADMAIQIEAARQLTYAAAAAVDAGRTGPEMANLAASAKCFASDVAMKVATDAVQIFGASGISNEFPINRYFRDAKVVQIVEGTNQIQRNIVARNLIGKEE